MAEMSKSGAELVEKIKGGLRLEDRHGGPRLVGADGFTVGRPAPGVVGKLVKDGVLIIHRAEGAAITWTLAEASA